MDRTAEPMPQSGGFTLNVNMPSAQANGMNRLLAEIKKKTLRSRVLNALLGNQQEVLIIMPSRTVDNVTFTHKDCASRKIAARSAGFGEEVAAHEV